jgi:hypothetical protein
LVFKLIYFGDLLPNPFYAKTGVSVEYLSSGLAYFGKFAYHYGLFGLFFLMPLPFARRLPEKIKLAWLVIVVYSLYIILVGGDVLKVHRFFLPILPMFFGIFVFLAWRVISDYKKIKWIPVAVALTSVGYIAWSMIAPLNYIMNTRYLETHFVEKMTFVTGELAKVDKTDFSIATTTIGKVSYMLKGHRVIDMLGLTDRYIAKNPEKIEGMSTTWKERNFNSAYLLELKPDYILFSTGHKASAPAERALVLNSHFRKNYSTIGFYRGGSMKVVWKKRGDFSEPNVQLPTTELADLMYDGLNMHSVKDHKGALSAFEKASEVCDHDFPLLEFFQGQQYLTMGKADEAIVLFRKALQDDPHQVETMVTLYRIYGNTGTTDLQRMMEDGLKGAAPWLLEQIESN